MRTWMVLLLLLIVLVVPTAESATQTFAIYPTTTREGYIQSQSVSDCPPGPYSVVTNATYNQNQLYWNAGVEISKRIRAFWSWPLDDVTGTADSAKAGIVVSDIADTDWNTDTDFYYGDCEIGTTCSDALTTTDWADVTSPLITIPWADMPAIGDTLWLSITAEQLGTVGAGHTFDLKAVNSKEADVCSATGYNGIKWYTVDEDGTGNDPRLYVYTHEAGDQAITYCNFRNSALQGSVNNSDPKYRKLGSRMVGIYRTQGGGS